MNFAFFGSPWFAAIILDKLIAGGFVPSVVVCNPDRPVGRKQLLTAPAVKQRIAHYESGIKDKIEILQPERLDTISLKLNAQSYDVFIVATYGKIISKSIYSLPRLGTIGVHHSLLPRHRGPTPVQSAIFAGDTEAGTTLFLMNERIDEGPIIAQERLNLGNSKGSTLENPNYVKLETYLAELSGELLLKTLPDFLAGKIVSKPQNESKATYTKKFSTQDAFIEEKDLLRAGASFGNPRSNLEITEGSTLKESFDKSLPIIISRKIRALNPEPGVWTYAYPLRFDLKNPQGRTLEGEKKRIKILEAEIRDGKLVLKKIQVEGGKPQSIG